jgi:hypothetical protein
MYVGSGIAQSVIAIGYGMASREVVVRDPVSHDSSPLHVVQTGSDVNPASYPKGAGALSPRLKRPGREADHSPPISAEVKNTWIYTSTPQCFHGVVLN